jgi:hypothetical protein
MQNAVLQKIKLARNFQGMAWSVSSYPRRHIDFRLSSPGRLLEKLHPLCWYERLS